MNLNKKLILGINIFFVFILLLNINIVFAEDVEDTSYYPTYNDLDYETYDVVVIPAQPLGKGNGYVTTYSSNDITTINEIYTVDDLGNVKISNYQRFDKDNNPEVIIYKEEWSDSTYYNREMYYDGKVYNNYTEKTNPDSIVQNYDQFNFVLNDADFYQEKVFQNNNEDFRYSDTTIDTDGDLVLKTYFEKKDGNYYQSNQYYYENGVLGEELSKEVYPDSTVYNKTKYWEDGFINSEFENVSYNDSTGYALEIIYPQ
jgi:hypothetical protein